MAVAKVPSSTGMVAGDAAGVATAGAAAPPPPPPLLLPLAVTSRLDMLLPLLRRLGLAVLPLLLADGEPEDAAESEPESAALPPPAGAAPLP